MYAQSKACGLTRTSGVPLSLLRARAKAYCNHILRSASLQCTFALSVLCQVLPGPAHSGALYMVHRRDTSHNLIDTWAAWVSMSTAQVPVL